MQEKTSQKIKNIMKNIARKIYLNESLSQLGKIVEEEDKIICYVKQSSVEKHLEKHKKNKLYYTLRLNGINTVNFETRELVERFNLEKPVYYIFDGINFSTSIQVKSLWATVIFKNCTFNQSVNIIWGDQMIFENNKYCDDFELYFHNKHFFSANRINKLTLKNEFFYNDSKIVPRSNFGIQINAKELNFINSQIEAESTLIIQTSKTNIQKSIISANEIYIDSESIQTTNSSIYAKTGIIIENESRDFNGKIHSNLIINNGEYLEYTETLLYNEAELLKAKREILLNTLERLHQYCKVVNNQKVTVNRAMTIIKKNSKILKKR